LSESSSLEIGRLAHKLINHVSILFTYAGLLKESGLEGEQLEMVEEMVEASKKAIGLCRDIERLVTPASP
jgi:hypothetical protein